MADRRHDSLPGGIGITCFGTASTQVIWFTLLITATVLQQYHVGSKQAYKMHWYVHAVIFLIYRHIFAWMHISCAIVQPVHRPFIIHFAIDHLGRSLPFVMVFLDIAITWGTAAHHRLAGRRQTRRTISG